MNHKPKKPTLSPALIALDRIKNEDRARHRTVANTLVSTMYAIVFQRMKKDIPEIERVQVNHQGVFMFLDVTGKQIPTKKLQTSTAFFDFTNYSDYFMQNYSDTIDPNWVLATFITNG